MKNKDMINAEKPFATIARNTEAQLLPQKPAQYSAHDWARYCTLIGEMSALQTKLAILMQWARELGVQARIVERMEGKVEFSLDGYVREVIIRDENREMAEVYRVPAFSYNETSCDLVLKDACGHALANIHTGLTKKEKT
jgi:hypothetical protein